MRRLNRSVTALLMSIVTIAASAAVPGVAHAAVEYCTEPVYILSEQDGPASTERNYTGSDANMLRARGAGNGAGSWEEYQICWEDTSEPTVVIMSLSASAWVAAEYGYSGSRWGMLRARSGAIGSWERFDIVALEDDNCERVAMWADEGWWVSVERNYTGSYKGMLRGRTSQSSGVGSWEKFAIVRVADIHDPVHEYFPCI